MGVPADQLPENYDPTFVKTEAANATDQKEKDTAAHNKAQDIISAINAQTAAKKAAKTPDDTYQEVKLKDGVYMVNKTDPTDRTRIGDLPPVGGTHITLPSTTGANGVVSDWEDIKDAKTRATLKGIASGQVDPGTLPISLRPGAPGITRQEGIGIIRQLVPGWDERMSAQSKKTIVDFAPNGTSGKAVTALNTLADHTALIGPAADALKNGDYQKLNDIANKFNVAIGKDPVTTYRTLMGVYAGEADKFMSGGNPTKEGAKEWEHRLADSNSPDQIRGSVGILTSTLKGKFKGYDQAYYNATSNNGANPELGKRLPETGLLTDEAKALFAADKPGAEGALKPGVSTKVIYDAKGQSHTAKLSADGKRWEL